MERQTSNKPVPDDYGGATFNSFDHVGAKSLQPAEVWGYMNDAQIRFQLELESVKTKGQSLPDGFQRRFLEAPELEESLLALQTVCPFNSIRLSCRKKLLSEFCSLHVPGFIFEVDADPMR